MAGPRRHYTCHSADPCISMDIRHRETTRLPRLLQRFKSYIETDLVPIFEEVGEGLPHDFAFDRVSLDAFGERESAKAYNLQGRVAKRGASGPPVYGNPHFVR